MKTISNYLRAVFAMILLSVFCFTAQAKIVKIVITKTEVYEKGRIFGNAGEYEKIYGQAFGEVNPNNKLNSIIQDIKLAPKNARGMVEYVSEFIILRPKDISKSNGLLFLSLPNRGNVFGADTALLKRGYVYCWAGWQGDVLPNNIRLTLTVPVATDNGKEITGKIRTEFEVNDPAKTQNLSSGYFNGLTHHTYETVSLNNSSAILTKRVHEDDPKIPIPNSDWAFADCNTVPFPGKPSTTQISLKDGFSTDYIYELIYTGKNPLVLGLGFAAIRDIASFFKHEQKDGAANDNPASGGGKTAIKAAIMQGVSQCGNFTRAFLQLGFNQDENKKIVFEGINDHIGTRRIALNIRFGRPGGGGTQREDHWFPSNEPPFTWDKTYEPISGTTAGILEKCVATHTTPKIMQTLSSTEYWQLRASLRTTDPYGKKDLVIPGNVRIYAFNSTEHSPYSAMDKVSGYMTNYNPVAPGLKAVIIALENWVLNGKLPPQSRYPKIANHTLAKPDKRSIGWPDIPGVTYTGKTNEGPLLNFGPRFDIVHVSGIIQEPPVAIKGKFYHVMVPKVDADGNELGGVRSTNILAPIGTFTGWSLRKEGYGKGDLAGLNGMFIPFKTTKAERLATGDPRLSLEERYQTHQGYVEAVKKAAGVVVKQGFLSPEDAAEEITKAEKSNILL